jgi:hypothetical protein
VYINLQPNGAKSLYRVNKEALESFLQDSKEEATVEESGLEACSLASF